MLVVPVLAACALASSREPETSNPVPPAHVDEERFTFCPRLETQRLVANRRKVGLAIGFKLRQPFREYEKRHGKMSPTLRDEIVEIFALHLVRDKPGSVWEECDGYDFLQEPNEKWMEMMKQYTDLSYLNLYCKHPLKKPLTAEIVKFFTDYCGTTRLALPSCEEGESLVDSNVPISKIQSLLIDATTWRTFPCCLRNFTGLTHLSIWYGDHTHVCPDMAGTEQAVLWPNLKEIAFFMTRDMERISRAFLEALVSSATLLITMPQVQPMDPVVRMAVGEFLSNVERFNVFPFCDGGCKPGSSRKLKFESKKRAYPFN